MVEGRGVMDRSMPRGVGTDLYKERKPSQKSLIYREDPYLRNWSVQAPGMTVRSAVGIRHLLTSLVVVIKA